MDPHRIGCELLKKAPKSDHTKLVRALACKVTLAARCDATSSNPDGERKWDAFFFFSSNGGRSCVLQCSFSYDFEGSAGEKLYNEVVAKLNRMQEPPPAKKPKPLPVSSLISGLFVCIVP